MMFDKTDGRKGNKMEAEKKMSDFGTEIIRQIRALDQFGNWSRISDEELLIKKYVKTKKNSKQFQSLQILMR